jgi:hypothetical protein
LAVGTDPEGTAMGTWGTGADDSDAAYDLFGDFFGNLFGPEKIEELREALRYYDDYGKIRAACHILQMLGFTLYWPRMHREELKELLELGIRRLTNMIHPPDSRYHFL